MRSLTLTTALLLTGCPKATNLPPHVPLVPYAYEGIWEDPASGDRATIAVQDDVPTVTLLEGAYREVQLTAQSWAPETDPYGETVGQLSWTSYVPEAGVHVTYRTLAWLDQGLLVWQSGELGESYLLLSPYYGYDYSDEYYEYGQYGYVTLEEVLGRWTDTDTGTVMQIGSADGAPVLLSIVDDDGEVYQPTDAYLADGYLTLMYFVPSTGYNVVASLGELSGTSLLGTWSSPSGSGEEEFVAVDTPLPASPESLAGKWRASGTQTLHEVALIDGVPTLQSIVDDSGEVMALTRQAWEGGVLSWEYHVGSTGYDVGYTVTDVQPDHLVTSWSGTAGAGRAVFWRE